MMTKKKMMDEGSGGNSKDNDELGRSGDNKDGELWQ
jgi:hypothetical protein